jgi:hypothetical protein
MGEQMKNPRGCYCLVSPSGREWPEVEGIAPGALPHARAELMAPRGALSSSVRMTLSLKTLGRTFVLEFPLSVGAPSLAELPPGNRRDFSFWSGRATRH